MLNNAILWLLSRRSSAVLSFESHVSVFQLVHCLLTERINVLFATQSVKTFTF